MQDITLYSRKRCLLVHFAPQSPSGSPAHDVRLGPQIGEQEYMRTVLYKLDQDYARLLPYTAGLGLNSGN